MPIIENIELVIMLTGAAAMTSFITAAMGIGGGVLLLAILATVLPVTALIPVHGLVQLGSNAHRAFLTHQHIDKPMVVSFSLGAFIGAMLASLVVVQLSLFIIQLSVALFILFMVWGPKPARHQLSQKGLFLAGAGTTFGSMFVGATGPLVAAVAHRHSDEKFAATANFASCMCFQHLLKVMVFSFVGFAFWEWLPVIALMIAGGSLGTWVGLRALNRIPTQYFSWIFKTVITLLAIRLLWQAYGTI